MKIVKLLSLLYSFVIITSFSQSKFDLYGNLSIDNAYSSNINNSPAIRGKNVIGFSASVGTHITKSIDLLVGASYTNKGYKIFRTNYPVGSIEDYWDTYAFKYLEIPIALKWKIVNKKIVVAPIVGISYGRLISLTSENNGDKVTLEPPLIVGFTNKNSMSTNLGVEISTSITQSLRIRIEPKFSYTFSLLNPYFVQQYVLYNLGVNVGVIKSF